jgi:small subunit ribosomal protein S16
LVKLRLKRLGRKKRPYYRIVAMNATSPRDGQALAEIGIYDPLLSKVEVDEEAALHWLNAGAQMTGTVNALLKNQGLLARWRGGEGAVTEGFLTLDKPKRQKKLVAAEAVIPVAKADEAPVAVTAEPAAAAAEVEAPAAPEADVATDA